METKSSKVLSSISYLSIFFAPFILPILIWMFSESPASSHGRRAFLNHVGILVCYFIGMSGFYFSQIVFEKSITHQGLISNISLALAIIVLFIAFSLAIYNLAKGLQLILQR